MKIRTLDHVNSHWADGRHFSAGAGAVTEVDDADKDAVAHMRHLVRIGLAEIVKDEPVKDGESRRPGRPRRQSDGEA